MTKQANSSCKIYVLGNSLLEEDSLPLRILPELRKIFPRIDFVRTDMTEELPEEGHLIIIDTVANASEIIILTEKEIDKLQPSPNYSLHDFDLAINLKLMKKMGKLNKLTILGVPSDMDEEKVVRELKKIISNLLSGN